MRYRAMNCLKVLVTMGNSASMHCQCYIAESLDYSLEFETTPFAEGSSRMAFRGVYKGLGPKNGRLCVTKVFKDSAARSTVSNYYPDARCSVVAEGYAKTFNRLFQPKAPLNFIQPALAKTRKLAITSSIAEEQPKLNHGDYISVEDFIPGDYRKFNSNTGWSLVGVEDSIPSFSHFTYHHSRGQLVVCDLQGVRGTAEFTLTDPAILSRRQEFGPADLGPLGMARFFQRHRCNRFCRDWRLPVVQPICTAVSKECVLPPECKSRAYRAQLNSEQRSVNLAYRERDDLPNDGNVDGAAP